MTRLGVLVWTTIVIVGTGVNWILNNVARQSSDTSKSSWVAARPMSVNHQLRLDDLELDRTSGGPPPSTAIESLLGHHLTKHVRRGDTIDAHDVSVTPLRRPASEGVVYAYPLNAADGALAGSLRPGDVVGVCGAGSGGAVSAAAECLRARVVAVHRRTSADALDYMLLSLSLNDAAIAILAAEQRILVAEPAASD